MDKDRIEYFFKTIKEEKNFISSFWDYYSSKVCNKLYTLISSKNELLLTVLKSFFPNIEELEEWMLWFMYDTDFGEIPMKATVYETKFTVTSFNVFWELLCKVNEKKEG